jgi:hypothetical protein
VVKLQINIRQIGAAFLMLIFLLAATPKKLLHDAITEHQHTKTEVQKCSHHHINITATGFNCQLDNLVVEMPFIIAIEPVFAFNEICYHRYSELPYNNIGFNKTFTAFLRGPPNC